MGGKIKYGMVGGSLSAFIGDVHRKAICFEPGTELVCGCFSENNEKNRRTAETYGISEDRAYARYRDMAEAESARSDGVDFVVIVTPNVTHYEISKAFLRAGIHVVCEKPLCFTVREAEELERIAAEKDLIFAVTYAYTGYTMVKVAREMIAEGAIGEIVAVNAEYAQDWLLGSLSAPESSPGESAGGISAVWRADPAFSGITNCVGDIGTHIESMVGYLTGLKIKRLLATVNRYGGALDLNANILLEYENGVNGSYWCSQVAAGRLNGLVARIYGTEGSLEWEQHFPDYLRYTPRGGAPRTLSRGCGYLTAKSAGCSRIPSGHPEGLYIGFANLYRNIVRAIGKKKDGLEPSADDMDFPTVIDGLSGVKFIHAVIESAANNSGWVDIRELTE
jgi:predicted dehydrogenase